MYSKYVLYLAECFRALNYLSLRTNSGGKRHPLWTEGYTGGNGELLVSTYCRHFTEKKTKSNKKTDTDLICECVFMCVCSHPGGLKVPDKCASGHIHNLCRLNTCSHNSYIQSALLRGRKQFERWLARYSFITITISFLLMIITSHFKPTKNQPDCTETDFYNRSFMQTHRAAIQTRLSKDRHSTGSQAVPVNTDRCLLPRPLTGRSIIIESFDRAETPRSCIGAPGLLKPMSCLCI